MTISPRDRTVDALCHYYEDQIDSSHKKTKTSWFGSQKRLVVRQDSKGTYLEYVPLSLRQRFKEFFSKNLSKKNILKCLQTNSQKLVESKDIKTLETTFTNFKKIPELKSVMRSDFNKKIVLLTKDILKTSSSVALKLSSGQIQKVSNTVGTEMQNTPVINNTLENKPSNSTVWTKEDEEKFWDEESEENETELDSDTVERNIDKTEVAQEKEETEETQIVQRKEETEETEIVPENEGLEETETVIEGIAAEDAESITEEFVMPEKTLSQELPADETFSQLASSLEKQLSSKFMGKDILITDLILARTDEGISFVHKDSLVGKKLTIEAALQQSNAVTEDVNKAYKILGETYDSFLKATKNMSPKEYEEQFQKFEKLQELLDKQLDDLVYHIIPKSMSDVADVTAVLLKAREVFDKNYINVSIKDYNTYLKEFEKQESLINSCYAAKS